MAQLSLNSSFFMCMQSLRNAFPTEQHSRDQPKCYQPNNENKI